jgi:hypothetical protein
VTSIKTVTIVVTQAAHWALGDLPGEPEPITRQRLYKIAHSVRFLWVVIPADFTVPEFPGIRRGKNKVDCLGPQQLVAEKDIPRRH